ncbi:membrane transport protein-domain-containing protein [Suillus bovinus]|uniref:membrane transport protein-domain-containing protein n=1 Tax=Suillus bovinus TaxID=48563 RepID=UPI001B882C0B|nr:membrane transport protein-domain-containing protein [Suillus bovinus]KAG2156926.1 membrane transport protein-domain-containing protein [Suillus bovinus]
MANTPIWPLLSTVFQSILEVFLVCSAGYILAWRRIIDKPTQRVINHINISLFTPALLFSKVAFFLSPAKLKELWIIPIFFTVVTIFSALVARVLSKIFGLKKSHQNFAMAASMFMNSNSLPIALMQSLVISVHGLKWTPDDNTDAMLGRALTYLVLYSTLGMMLRWSYGVRLLSSADTPPTPTSLRSPQLAAAPYDAEGAQYIDNASLSDEATLNEHHRLPRSQPTSPTSPSHHWQSQVHPTSPLHYWQTQARTQAVSVTSPLDDTNANDQDTACEIPTFIPEPAGHIYGQLHPHPSPSYRHLSPPHPSQPSSSRPPSRSSHSPHPSRNMAIYHSSPNSPSREHTPLVSDNVTPADSEDEIEDGTEVIFQHHQHHERLDTGLRHIWKRTKSAWRSINAFMTMPLWASLLSLVVACTPPLQSALEHMEPVKGALSAAGNCSIPLTLVVLGAYFYSEPPEDDMQSGDLMDYETDETRRDLRKSRTSLLSTLQEILVLKRAQPQPQTPGESKTVFVAVLARMVVVPAVMLPVMAILSMLDIHDIFEDPVFMVSNVLLIASPPALTLAQMTQAASNDSFERLISRTVFWSYCVVTPPSTILVVVLGLLIAKL